MTTTTTTTTTTTSTIAEALVVTRTKTSASEKIGLTLGRCDDSSIRITRVSDTGLFGSASGLQVGHQVVSVNGQSVVAGMSVKDVVEMLTAAETTVTLEVAVVSPTEAAAAEAATLEEETFEDACQVGQCVINPVWFLYLSMMKLCVSRGWLKRTSSTSGTSCASDKAKSSSSTVDTRRQSALRMSTLQQTLYLVFFYTSWTIVFGKAIPLNQAKQHLSNFHGNVLVPLLFVVAVVSWIAAKQISPGKITSETLHRFDNYRYDGVLYHASSICPTVGIRKLARSKYDRYCNANVPRFDHYCGWLGNTIGEENYRFFMAFLAVHVVMVLYGFATLAIIIHKEATLLRQHQEDADPSLSVIRSITQVDPCLLGVCSFNFLVSFPLMAFLYFHLHLIQQGMTTNEYYKWLHLKEQQQQQQQQQPSHYGGDVEKAAHSYTMTRLPIVVQTAQQFYNLGLWGNLYEVIFPRSLRQEHYSYHYHKQS